MVKVSTIIPAYNAERTIAQAVDFIINYSAFNRVVELKFTRPLQQFRTLKVELLDGILGIDQQPLKAWTLTFEIGGS